MGLWDRVKGAFRAEEQPIQEAPQLRPKDEIALAKGFKPANIKVNDVYKSLGLNPRGNYEVPRYDFVKIQRALATDSYVSTAFSKYMELMWKEGYDLLGEKSDNISYILQRFDYFSLAMQRDFDDFLFEVADQLIKFANCFLVKVRGPLQEFFPRRLVPINDNSLPVIGYFVLPVELVKIRRNPKTLKPVKYKIGEGESERIFDAREVIHLHLNRQPGQAFGYPFVLNVLDDVITLRQLEEDVANLVHNELFTIPVIRVGTDAVPASEAEMARAESDLDRMRTEGGLIMPHHYNFDLHGSEGSALDATGYLAHFKQRVAVGLGVNEIHLGMASSANRSVSDRLDVALYDRIKVYQRYFASQIQLSILNELLLEAGLDPYANPSQSSDSDRVLFKFREIDVDTQVKKDANTVFLFTSNLIEIDEARKDLGRDPDVDPSKLHYHFVGVQQALQSTPQQGNDSDSPPRGSGSRPGTQTNSPNGSSKGAANKVNPKNQNGTRTSPNIRRDDDGFNPVFEKVQEEWGALVDNVYDAIRDSDQDFKPEYLRTALMLSREGIEDAIRDIELGEDESALDAREKLSREIGNIFERFLQHLNDSAKVPDLNRLATASAIADEFWTQLTHVLERYEVNDGANGKVSSMQTESEDIGGLLF